MPDDIQVVSCGNMGAPTILIEKIPSGEEPLTALACWEAHTGKRVDAIVPMEAGGVNSMIPVVVAAARGLPVIDADPQLEMETFNVYGVPASPVAIANERGDTVVINCRSAAFAEWLARGITIRMGGRSSLAEYGMDGATARRVSVPGTMSLAIGIGRVLRDARRERAEPIAALIRFFAGTHYERAKLLGAGKITDVDRATVNGWSVGTVRIDPFEAGAPAIFVRIQNENLVATCDGAVLAIVPDLICILDADTAEPITTERLRYGQRVKLLAVQVPPIMRTPEALAVFGPAAFGLPYPYQGLS